MSLFNIVHIWILIFGKRCSTYVYFYYQILCKWSIHLLFVCCKICSVLYPEKEWWTCQYINTNILDILNEKSPNFLFLLLIVYFWFIHFDSQGNYQLSYEYVLGIYMQQKDTVLVSMRFTVELNSLACPIFTQVCIQI